MHAAPLLDVRDLSVHFGPPARPVRAVDGISFSVQRGEVVALVGPSGCGKTTLLSVIAGILARDGGRCSVFGTDSETLRPRDRLDFRAETIGFIFQQFNLLPWLSAMENVLLPCRFSALRRRYAGAERSLHDEAARLMAQLDLAPETWPQQAAEMSVGQQQRVAAARALIGRPSLIVADEPTSALDAPRQQAFVDLLLRETAAAGAALIFVSHDRRLAAHFDRELSLDEINRAGGVAVP